MVSHTAQFSRVASPKAVAGGVLPHQGYESTTIGGVVPKARLCRDQATTIITNAQGRPRKPTALRQAAGSPSRPAAAPFPVHHHS